MFKLLITLGAVMILVGSVCPQSSMLDNLEGGSADLVLNNNAQISTSKFEKAFTTQFSNIPMVAFTIHDFIANTPQIDHWALFAPSVTQTSVTIQFDYERNRWGRMLVGFWASDRDDLIVGHGSAQLGMMSGQIKPVKFNLPRPLPQPSGSIIRSFLNGLILENSTSISVRIYQNTLAQDSFELNVDIGAAMTAKKIYISFITFNPNQAGFVSYGSGISQRNFQGIKIYDLHRNVYNAPYAFHGYLGLEIDGTSRVGISSSINEEYILRIRANREIKALVISYIIIGVAPSTICADCDEKFIFENTCVNACPENTYVFNYTNGGSACRECPLRFNFVLNDDRTGCKCRDGFQILNGLCQRLETTPQPESTPTTPSFEFQEGNSFTPEGNSGASNVGESGQSFVPNPSPSVPVLPQLRPPTVEQPRPVYVDRDCSNIPNSFWTGYRCACRVGFISQNGLCVATNLPNQDKTFRPAEFIYKISRLYTRVECVNEGQMYDQTENVCKCMDGFYRTDQGRCEPIRECPPNSMFMNGNCICNPGFRKQDDICVRECPEFSIDNGLGQCICINGYFKNTEGMCVKGQVCPAFSTRDLSGKCVCLPGYTDFGTYCARCPEGQFYVAETNQCIIPCGVNEVLNNNQQCVCQGDFGKFQGVCQECPADFFVFDGFCVSCPLQSTYDKTAMKCVCQGNLMMNEIGACVEQCTGVRQVYSDAKKKCVCFAGLGFLNGVCTECPFGVNAATDQCNQGCGPNQVAQGANCVCRSGFGFNQNNECINCTATAGGFQVDGFCAVCPNTFMYNGVQCVCGAGKQNINGICIDQCGAGELLDLNGNCYICPINEIVVNDRCECIAGYERKGAICELQCAENQVVINGLCGRCVGQSIYNPNLQSCVCPTGFYRNNFGFCEASNLTPVNCDPGFFYDPTNGCLSCPLGCTECTNSLTCTKCPQFYTPMGAECKPNCGDGYVIAGVEQCDDGNAASNDGCSNCMVVDGWICTGIEPSVCQLINGPSTCGNGMMNANERCDDANTNNGDGCSSGCQVENGWTCTGFPSVCTRNQVVIPTQGMRLVNVVTNYANVFIILETEETFIFNTEDQMRRFMKYEFVTAGTEPTSAYCVQNAQEKKMFQCLMIYPSGVPNKQYMINFSFDRNGIRGSLPVKVDPLANPFASRSLL